MGKQSKNSALLGWAGIQVLQNQTKSPTGRSAVRTRDWRHFERARTAAREARSVWVDQGSPEWNEHEASERPSTRSARPSFAIGHRLPFPSRLRVREGRRSRAGKAGGMKVMQRRILLALVAVLCAAIGVQGTSPSTTRSRDETPRRERDRDPRVDPPPTQGRGSPAMNKLTNLTTVRREPDADLARFPQSPQPDASTTPTAPPVWPIPPADGTRSRSNVAPESRFDSRPRPFFKEPLLSKGALCRS